MLLMSLDYVIPKKRCSGMAGELISQPVKVGLHSPNAVTKDSHRQENSTYQCFQFSLWINSLDLWQSEDNLEHDIKGFHQRV